MIIHAKHYERGKSGKHNSRSKYTIPSKAQIKRANVAESLFDEEADCVGWETLKKGWPDRLIYNPDTRQTILVEIKSGHDSLRASQKKMHKALKRLGIKVIVLRINPDGKNAGLELREYLYSLIKSKTRIIKLNA